MRSWSIHWIHWILLFCCLTFNCFGFLKLYLQSTWIVWFKSSTIWSTHKLWSMSASSSQMKREMPGAERADRLTHFLQYVWARGVRFGPKWENFRFLRKNVLKVSKIFPIWCHTDIPDFSTICYKYIKLVILEMLYWFFLGFNMFMILLTLSAI